MPETAEQEAIVAGFKPLLAGHAVSETHQALYHS